MTHEQIPAVSLDMADHHFGAVLRDGAAEFGALELRDMAALRVHAAHVEARLAAFFAGDEAGGRRADGPAGHRDRGWTRHRDDDGGLGFERIGLARFDDPRQARAAGVADRYLPLFQDVNAWPGEPLRGVVQRYRDVAVEMSGVLLGRLTRAWGMPRGALSGDGPDHTHLALTQYYPRADVSPDDPAFAARRDRSLFTLFTENGEPDCLRIERADGAWLTYRPKPNAVLLVFGTTAENRTGGLVRACRYQVLPPRRITRVSTEVSYLPSLAAPARDGAAETVGDVLLEAMSTSLP
ncbi:2OG-Fe(II) oxygenase family protein [Spirillospora sp. NPDC047279]|uniref:2OG-Fe(II) oxygenase family protein n=1 Tax=Spirillospora sp. NPDC047279 TaxID=3155478 RepID=UPI0033F8757C